MTDRIRAFIFARGGSKGVPGKNIRPLGGKPLIAHAIDCALTAPSLGEVVVSTDDTEIARVARAAGAQVPFLRPADLAGDTSPEWMAWRHAIQWFADQGQEFDIMVSLPTTSPFRAVEDVEVCIAALRNDPDADVVISVKRADRSPYFNMIKLDEAGYAGLVITPHDEISRRQDAADVFDVTTVAYAVRTRFVMEKLGLFQGKVRTIEVPVERALDIDTSYDFWLAELLMEHQQRERDANGKGADGAQDK